MKLEYSINSLKLTLHPLLLILYRRVPDPVPKRLQQVKIDPKFHLLAAAHPPPQLQPCDCAALALAHTAGQTPPWGREIKK